MPMPTSLTEFATRYVGRELTPEELQTLQQFLDTIAAQRPPPGLASHAHPLDAQRLQLAAERERNLAAIQQILAESQAELNKAQVMRQEAAQSLLDRITAAESLDALRPSALAPEGSTPEHLLLAQIADRLALLVQKEVKHCFERQFGLPAPDDAPALMTGMTGTPRTPDTIADDASTLRLLLTQIAERLAWLNQKLDQKFGALPPDDPGPMTDAPPPPGEAATSAGALLDTIAHRLLALLENALQPRNNGAGNGSNAACPAPAINDKGNTKTNGGKKK